MKSVNLHLLAYYAYFFVSKYSSGIVSLTKPLMDENSLSIQQSSTTPKLKQSSTRIRTSKFMLSSRIAWESYCENIYSAADVEELLDIDMECQTYYENWWREEDLFFIKRQISYPLCSAFPNMELPITAEISDHKFFRARNIHIPIKLGRRGQRINKYEHLKKEPIWRIMLECDCRILENVNLDGDVDVCVNGKVVTLSRGVGGDDSFFVHVPNPTMESFKVVAHICLH